MEKTTETKKVGEIVVSAAERAAIQAKRNERKKACRMNNQKARGDNSRGIF